jgi:lipopolysaccharide export system permease protein
MRLLDRYLLRELLIPLGYCLGGFLVFWTAFDLFTSLPLFRESRLKGVEVIEYYIVKTPELLVTVLPISLLLASLYALTLHARHHELVAIRAAGVGLGRLSIPYLGVGFVMSLALFAINEFWVPRSTPLADAIIERHLQNKPDAVNRQWHSNLNFSNDRDQRIWSIVSYHADTLEMLGPMVDWRAPDGSVRKLFAERAIRTNDAWLFQNVKVFVYEPPDFDIARPMATNELVVPEFNETPELIRSEIKISAMTATAASRRARLSLGEMINYRRLHPQLEGDKRSLLLTQWYGRLAAPWTCLVVVLIAIPFGSLSGRRNVMVGVAASIFICFGYFVLLQLGMNLGTAGRASPFLAAWLPNIVFAAVGLILTQRVR